MRTDHNRMGNNVNYFPNGQGGGPQPDPKAAFKKANVTGPIGRFEMDLPKH